MQISFPSFESGFDPIFRSVEPLVFQEGVSLVGIVGRSASGKSTLAQALHNRVIRDCTSRVELSAGKSLSYLLSTDRFYNNLPPELFGTNDWEVNHDHPDRVDVWYLVETLAALKQGKPVKLPFYNFGSSTTPGFREQRRERMQPPRVVFVEGFVAFDPRLIHLYDKTVFVDADEEICLGRRTVRDVSERGKLEEHVSLKWNGSVEPMYQENIAPYAHLAEMMVKNNASELPPFMRALLE